MSVRVLGVEWEGAYSCRYCGSICSGSPWSEPHRKKDCLEALREKIDSGLLVLTARGRLGDVAFERKP